MRNIVLFRRIFPSRSYTQIRSFSTNSKEYNPNVVNQAINPKPGKLLKSVPPLFLLAVAMLAVPLVVTYYDNKDFEKEMERRKQPGVRY